MQSFGFPDYKNLLTQKLIITPKWTFFDIISSLLILLLSFLPNKLILCYVLPDRHYFVAKSKPIMQSWFINYD